MNIKHPFVKPEIECTLAAGCAVTGEPFAIELAHVKGRLTMVSAKPIKAGAGGGSGGLKPALTSLDLSDGMDTGRTYHCPHCGNKNIVRCGKCHGITCYDGEGVKRLDNVSFTALGGEILGIAGIAGSGQRELLEAIAGLHPVAEGSIQFTPGVKAEPGYPKRGPRW